jgi:Do/DeqQ family serine protease
MKKVFIGLAVIIASIANAADRAEFSLNPMLNKVMPAVVNIRAQHENNFSQQENPSDQNEKKQGGYIELGSGVILGAKNGLIVTNAHVIHDASTILVTLSDNRKYIANLIGEDMSSDIAILHIDAKNLTQIEIGATKDIKVGDFVTAIGNPFGLHQTATSGIVSGLHRRSLGGLNNFIQTDAPINPGNSGGALINMKGELIGINTSILSTGNSGNIGIGFAIPSDLMSGIVYQLLKYNNVKTGLLGVTLQELTPQLGKALKTKTQHGVIINSVTPESAAEKAGLQKNDIITSINDHDVYTSDEAKSYIGIMRENSKVSLTIERDSSVQQKYAILSPMRILANKKPASILSGMTLMDYDEIDESKNRTRGLMVTNVEQGSKVWLGGLSRGDIIISINGKNIQNLDEFSEVENSIPTNNENGIIVDVKRGHSNYLIVVE